MRRRGALAVIPAKTTTEAAGRRRGRVRGREGFLTRCVDAVFAFVRLAEFEILFLLFVLVAFLFVKDLTSRPEYNQILVKRPGDDDFWPFANHKRED